MTSAVVVGSGPNGLVAAITLAQHGVDVTVLEAKDRVGGGARSSQLTLPGLIHDECSAFHPTGAASPVLQRLDLQDHGLRWRWPEVQLAHPLEAGRAGVLWRDVDRTAAGMGPDGKEWTSLFRPLARHFDALAEDFFKPVVHVPAHPLTMARFGLSALLPASRLVRRFTTPEARALFGGVAAHVFTSLHTPLSSSVGLLLTAAGHAYGWPVAEGGSQAITDALVAKLTALGGVIQTGVEVGAFEQLGDPDLVLLETTPQAAAAILGDRLTRTVKRSYARYRYGPAAFKVDLAVQGHIPWDNPDVRRAGTVHLGGSFEETAAVEGQIVDGTMPERPFVLLGQQYLADPSRSEGDLHPIWAYAHVPNGYAGDATQAIIAQIERFAPGFRQQIRQVVTRDVSAMQRYNANYVGGDISAGANSGLQIAMRPRIAVDPYATGVPGVYLCSSATPPGGGVHGMCGYNAALSALTQVTAEDAS